MPTSKADSSNSFGSSEEEGLTIRVKNEGKAKSTLSPKPILSTGEKDREVSEPIHQKSRLSTDSKPRQSNSPRPTVCKNNASSICYNYKPRAVQVAGFGSLDLTPKHVPEIYQKDEYLVDKYKFLKFPSPQPNSILFHSLQGDLLRKRQCIDDVLVVEGNNDNEGLKKCDSEVSGTQIQPDFQISGRSESVVDLSAYLGSTIQEPSPPWYSLIFPKQPLFWKLDEDVHSCQKCAIKFTFLTRRHHCRGCGQIFCHFCSRFRAPFSRDGHRDVTGGTERACEECLVSTWQL